MRQRSLVMFVIVLATVLATAASAQAAGTRLVVVARGFTQPVYVTGAPGDGSRLYVVQKNGVIRILRNGQLLPQPFLNLSGHVSQGGEQGLFSIAFRPGWPAKRRVFVSYTNLAGDSRVVSYLPYGSSRERLNPWTRRVELAVDQPFANHNGGHIAFGPGGGLFVGLGDGGGSGDPGNRAQRRTTRLGKMLRLDIRRYPPAVVQYARGVRNPWRFSFDRATGDLWIADVGQNRFEEVHVIRRGAGPGINLGWSYYEGHAIFRRQPIDRRGLRFPVAVYDHTRGCSITGGYVYRGDAAPTLRGYYVYADLCSGRVWKRPASGGSSTPTGFSQQVPTIVSFGEGANGALFVVSFSGTIYRVIGVP